jgi:hypothetical protein
MIVGKGQRVRKGIKERQRAEGGWEKRKDREQKNVGGWQRKTAQGKE